MMAQISPGVAEVATVVGLAADELSKPCDSSIIPSLADCFREWRVIFGSLLSDLDLGDVDRENTTEEEKRIAALRKWRDRKGREATYKILVDALLNKGERYQAESLCKTLADQLSNKNETTTTDYDAKESESDIQFQCPCGKCSLETYLQEGCPKSCIPYLGMTTLSEEDQENLNYILKKDTQKIIKSFANLSNETCSSLIRQGVTVDSLVRVAINSDSSLYDKLMESKSVDRVFSHLGSEISFFNHEILKDIINVFGDENDKIHLVDYSKEFKEFCKRKVFEVEPGHCTCGQRLSKLKQRKVFAVVLPTGEKRLQNLGDAVSIKEMLADDLDVPLATLHLHRIDRGCIILVFSVPDSVAETLFPLPKEKIALLRVKGMVVFVPKDSESESNQVEDVTACSADMHEASSNTVPSVIHVPGHLLVSYSLPVGGSAQFSWTSVPEDKQNDTIGKPDSSQEIPAMIEAGAGPPMRISSATPQGRLLGDPLLGLRQRPPSPDSPLELSSHFQELIKHNVGQITIELPRGDSVSSMSSRISGFIAGGPNSRQSSFDQPSQSTPGLPRSTGGSGSKSDVRAGSGMGQGTPDISSSSLPLLQQLSLQSSSTGSPRAPCSPSSSEEEERLHSTLTPSPPPAPDSATPTHQKKNLGHLSEDLAQSNSGDRESRMSSNEFEEPSERKPVEATDTPTGGTSALVPSSSPPKSSQYLNNMAKLLKTYAVVDIPTPASVDPADQHRDFEAMQSIEGVSLCSVLRDKTVKTITKTLFLPNSELPLPSFIVDNTNLKVCCSLHPLGLGNDRMGHNKSMTVTSAIHLPRVNSTCTNLLNESHCTITLSVSIYDGEIEIGHSSASQRITDEDRRNRRVHMVVHHVASQDDIVFRTVSDKIGFKIKIRIEAG